MRTSTMTSRLVRRLITKHAPKMLSLIAVTAFAVPLTAKPTAGEFRQNLDVRLQQEKAPSSIRSRSAARQDAGRAIREEVARGESDLRIELPSLKVNHHELHGSPKLVTNGRGPLTKGSKGKPEDIVRNFVSRNSRMFGLSRTSFEDSVKTEASYKNPKNNVNWVTLKQEVRGIPVFQAELRAGLTPAGELVALTSDFVPGLDDDKALTLTPALSAEDAVARSAEHVGFDIVKVDLVRKADFPDSDIILFENTLDATLLRAEQVIFPLGPGNALLAWQTVIGVNGRMYILVIDATTGEILFRKNAVSNQTQTATYEVYDRDSPAPGTPWPADAFPGTQAPYTSRTLHTLVSELPEFDNLGWISDGDNRTRGNNVVAGRDQFPNDGIDIDPYRPGFDAMAYGTGSGPSPNGRNFVFGGWEASPGGLDRPLGRFPGEANEGFDSGSVTNMFFWVNRFHDRLYELGFTEPAKNFQANNFGRGGQSNDAVFAQAQDYSGTNNANFATPPDGSAGTMQMYVWTSPTPDRDGALDQQIILHELGHGLSNRLINNGLGLLFLQGGGMGEGWSDFYALSLLSDYAPDNDPNKIYPMGGYSTNNLIGPFDNYRYGVRRYPYSTDMNHNPFTFADTDPSQYSTLNPHTGIPIPGDPRCNFEAGAQVHNLGEIWASMLWEVRALIMDQYKNSGAPGGWKDGNQHMLQIVTDAMKLTPSNPTFTDSRDAILAAALLQNGSPINFVSNDPNNTTLAAMDELAIWTGFAKRGLGRSAIAPPPMDENTTETHSVNYYGAKRFDFGAPNGTPAETEKLVLPDGGNRLISLPQPVTFYGVQYTSIRVYDDGFITFGTDTDEDTTETLENHFERPRISALMTDLDPTTGTEDTYIAAIDRGDSMVIKWNEVPLPREDDEAPFELNTFAIELNYDNPDQNDGVSFGYDQIAALHAVVGLSRGEGIPKSCSCSGGGKPMYDVMTMDLSALTSCNPNVPKPSYFTELFDTDDMSTPPTQFDLSNMLFQFEHGFTGGWYQLPVEAFDIPLTVTQPIVSDPFPGGNGNGAIEPGEEVEIWLPVTNEFVAATVSDVWGILSTPNGSGIIVTEPVAPYGVIPAGGFSNGLAPYKVKIAAQVPCGATFTINVGIITAQTGLATPIATTSFEFRVATVLGDPIVFTQNQSVPIPDGNNGGVVVELDVADIPAVGELAVNLNSIPHPRVGELSISLTGPRVEDIVIDSSEAVVNGPWTSSNFNASALNGSHLQIAKGSGANTVTYRPSITYTGLYNIYEWHPALSTYTGVAQITVNHSSGSQTSTRSQRINGGTWNLIGQYLLTAGNDATVVISDNYTDTGQLVIADGMKFVYAGPNGGRTISLIDNIPHQTGLNTSSNIANVVLKDSSPQTIQNESGSVVGLSRRSAVALTAFRGQPAIGKWKLRVIDRSAQHLGSIESWGLTVRPLLTPCPDVGPLFTSEINASPVGWTAQPSGVPDLQDAFYKPGAPSTLVLRNSAGEGYRAPGWQSPGVPYEPIGNQIYRFNAHVARTNQPEMNNQAQWPHMMLKAHVRFAQDNTAYFQFNPTYYDPITNDIMRTMSPSTDPANPTHYYVDFDPVDVPSLTTPTVQMIRGTVQNLCLHPEQQGDLEIVESSIVKYLAPAEESGTVLRTYTGEDFSYGMTYALNLSNPNPYSYIPHGLPELSTSAAGVTIDTTHVTGNNASYISYDFVPPNRIEPQVTVGKTYRVRYHLSSNTPSNNNPRVNLRARTIKWNYTQAFGVGGAKSAGALNNQIASEALPGIGTLNPHRRIHENTGGYYDQWFDSPPVLPTDSTLKRLRFGFDVMDGVVGELPVQNSVNGRITLDYIEVKEFDKVAP